MVRCPCNTVASEGRRTNLIALCVFVLERAEGLQSRLLERSSDSGVLAVDLKGDRRSRAGRQRTGLGFVHGLVGVRFGAGVVVRPSFLAVADFALVFALLALCRRQFVAAVAAEAEVRPSARTLALLHGLICWRRHVPSFLV